MKTSPLLTSIISGLLFWSPLSLLAEAPLELNPKEAAIQNLFAADNETSFTQTSLAAREVGVSEQTILEARFLMIVDQNVPEKVVQLIPDLERQANNFKLADSQICSVKEEWLAIVEYARAIKALEADDQPSFKKHITEAFWLCPERAPAYAPYIKELRMEKEMAQITINFDLQLSNTLNQKATPLLSEPDQSKGLIIHFWSPWSRECEAGMPDFYQVSKLLSEKGFHLVSVLTEKSESATKEAKDFIQSLEKKPTCLWLSDNRKAHLTGLFRIQNLPTMVLVGKEGKVLFNGHPADEGFWKRLQKIDRTVERPKQAP